MSILIKGTLQQLGKEQGLRLQDVNELANQRKVELGQRTSTTQSLSEKINKETIRLREFELFLDVLGYELKVVKKQ